MIEIHDNFLNKKDFDKLLEAFTQNNTPFYLQKSIIEYPKPDNHVQMFHILYENNVKRELERLKVSTDNLSGVGNWIPFLQRSERDYSEDNWWNRIDIPLKRIIIGIGKELFLKKLVNK